MKGFNMPSGVAIAYEIFQPPSLPFSFFNDIGLVLLFFLASYSSFHGFWWMF